MPSVTGAVRKFDSGVVVDDSARRPKRYLASDAAFGVGTARGAALSKVSVLGLVLASKRLKPVSRTAACRGPFVAQGHDDAEQAGRSRDE